MSANTKEVIREVMKEFGLDQQADRYKELTERLEKQGTRLEALEKGVAQRHAPDVEGNGQFDSAKKEYTARALRENPMVLTQNKAAGDKGLMIARYVRAKAHGKETGRRAHEVLHDWGDKALAEQAEAYEKALSSSVSAAGAELVAPAFVAELIELLRNRTVIRGAPGVNEVPMPNGTMEMPRQTGAATASYSGENQNITSSQPTFGSYQMSAKKLTSLVPVSNDLLRTASVGADAIVRNDLARVMAIREDLAFIRGDGTSGTPSGIRTWMAAAQAANQSGTAIADVLTDYIGMMGRLATANVDVNPGEAFWLMSERTKYGLMRVPDGDGRPYFLAEVMSGSLLGYPIRSTNQVPNNLSTNQSEVYFVAGQHCIIGDTLRLQLDSSQEAAYFDGSALQSTFSRDQTAIRAISEHDFLLRQDVAVSRLDQVTLA